MKARLTVMAGVMLAAFATPAAAEIEIDGWGNQIISFEGLVQVDYNQFNDDVASLNGDVLDGSDSDSELRRAEIILKGTGEKLSWVLGYDAKADKFLDANFKYKFSSLNSITVGQYKQPNSLEELGSTKNNDFISKAMTTNLFAVARRMGVAMTTSGETWTVTGSVFGREMTRNLAQGDGYGLRGTFTPFNDFSGNFLHLGVSAVEYDAADATADGRARLRVRPDADLSARRLIDSGQFTNADRIRTLGFEAAWAKGPFKATAEYMKADISRSTSADYSADSWYMAGVWNVTGEAHGYKNGVIVTEAPADASKGMWQLGLRYDHADLNDNTGMTLAQGAVFGGEESNVTAGVNYYWHSNFKLALNYVKVSSEKGAVPIQDDPSIVELRAQFFW